MLMQISLKRIVAGLLFLGATLAAQDAGNSSDAFYAAIRANDLLRLGAMVKQGAAVNVKDTAGVTPLMYAAEVGSVDAMKLLLDGGADVNLKNNNDATALMWSATDIAKVRLLLGRGADVNAATKRGRTALILAALSDQSADIVRLLIAHGADVKATDAGKLTALRAAAVGNDTDTIHLLVESGLDVNGADFSGFTPLISAAWNGNVDAAKLLVAKGADVNAVSNDGSFQKVKAGTIALGNWTPLLAAAAGGPPELVDALLAAGAQVNVRDVRGMTPLMLAVATDHQNLDVIRTLIAHGADPNVKSLSGETALDWAKKIRGGPVMEALKASHAAESVASHASVPAAAPASLTASVERSMVLLEKTSLGFAAGGGCASCHSHNVLDITAAAMRAKGLRVDEKLAADRHQLSRAPFFSPSVLLERGDGPGSPDLPFYSLAAMASAAHLPDRATDAMVANTAVQQLRDGRWHVGGVARPPIEDGDIFRTALGIRALKVYAPPGRAVEMTDRIARAARWLEAAKPVTTEDRAM